METYKGITKNTDKYIKEATSVTQIQQYLAIERTKTNELFESILNQVDSKMRRSMEREDVSEVYCYEQVKDIIRSVI